jgi:hypothetical protein
MPSRICFVPCVLVFGLWDWPNTGAKINTYYRRTKRDDHLHLKSAFPFMQCRSLEKIGNGFAVTS